MLQVFFKKKKIESNSCVLYMLHKGKPRTFSDFKSMQIFVVSVLFFLVVRMGSGRSYPSN